MKVTSRTCQRSALSHTAGQLQMDWSCQAGSYIVPDTAGSIRRRESGKTSNGRTVGPLDSSALGSIILASIIIDVVLISADNDICPTTPVSASDRRFPGGWPAAGVRGASTGPSPGWSQIGARTIITRNHGDGLSAAPAKTDSGCKLMVIFRAGVVFGAWKEDGESNLGTNHRPTSIAGPQTISSAHSLIHNHTDHRPPTFSKSCAVERLMTHSAVCTQSLTQPSGTV